MDLTKAYDYLPHDLIIAKFELYGFDSISLKLFHRYFSNRKQRVKTGSAIRVYPFSTYAKFSEKLKFLTPKYAHVRVCIRGQKC